MRLRIVLTGAAVAIAVLSAPATSPATFPGANGKIAYVHSLTDPATGDARPPQIWVVEPDGSGKRQLTQSPSGATAPAWSPDGTKIAFTTHSPSGGLFSQNAVWVMDADGENATRVTPAMGSFGSPAYSPDGQRLAVSGFIPEEEGKPAIAGIFSIDLDGSDLQLVHAGGGSPSWSPDGEAIAFEAEVAAASQLLVMDSDGTDVRQLTHTFRYHGRPDWTPDGRIAFIANELGDQASTVHVINRDGTGQKRVHNNPFGGDTESVSWSPDGSRFAFSTYLGGGGGFPFTYRIHTAASDGSDESEVVADERADTQPSWQSLPLDATPPTLHTPGAIELNATSTLGAVVEYSVSVSDDNDPSPAVTCEPASGSTFPIGTTTVQCEARDAAGNLATASFAVTVLGAADQMEDLIEEVAELDLPPGLTNVLGNSLKDALAAVGTADVVDACADLADFINRLEVLPGQLLDSAQRDDLIAKSHTVAAILTC